MSKDLNFKVGNQYKSFDINKTNINTETRTVEITFASELAYDRGSYFEVIDLAPGAMNLTRLNNKCAFLFNHHHDINIGVIENAYVDSVERKAKATVRFSKNAKADEIFQDVIDGILTKISFGYEVTDMELAGYEGDKPIMRVKTFPYEISQVTIPADDSVGIGRSKESNVKEFNIKAEEEPKEEVKPVAEPESKPEDEAKKSFDDECDCDGDYDEDNCEECNERAKSKLAEEEEQEKVRLLALKEKEIIIKENNNNKGNSSMDIAGQIKAIFELGDSLKQHGGKELAESFIRSGNHDFKSFEVAMLEKMKTVGGVATASTNPQEAGLSGKEVKQYSLFNAIRAKLAGENSFELEVSASLEKKMGRKAKGIFVPMEYLKRDMSVGSAVQGGNTVATDLRTQDFITILRNKLAIQQLGATFLTGLQGNVAISRQTGGASAGWVAENGILSESSAQFDQLPLSPKTVGGFTDISRLFMEQSSLNAESFVMNELATVLAHEIDRTAIYGTGTGTQPRGILNTNGISSLEIGPNGGYATWDHIVALETAVAAQNADLGNLAYLTNSKVRGKLKSTQKANALEFVYGNGDRMNDYKVAISNKVGSAFEKGTSDGLSQIIFGNWSDFIIAQWGVLDVQIDPYTQNTKGAVRVLAFQDVDMAVRHPESFAVIGDVKTN